MCHNSGNIGDIDLELSKEDSLKFQQSDFPTFDGSIYERKLQFCDKCRQYHKRDHKDA